MVRVQIIDRLGSEPNLNGTIHVTTSHVVFRADEGVKEIWVTILLSHIPSSFLNLDCKRFNRICGAVSGYGGGHSNHY
jgi:hypothetical protein